MPDYDQIVVGVGTSALTFLHGAITGHNKGFSAQKTLAIGADDLWNKVNRSSAIPHPSGPNYGPPDKMGQPIDLLGPIHKSNNPSGGLNNVKVNRYNQETASLKSSVQGAFQSARKDLTFLDGSVEKVTKLGKNKFNVQVKGSTDLYEAKQVIVASGPGPAQTPQAATRNNNLIEGNEVLQTTPRQYKEVVSGDEYLCTGPDSVAKTVLVHGSSPTSAWAVAHAIYLQSSKVYWLARTSFDDANPAGRNSAVILYASENGLMQVGNLKKIKVLDATDGKPRLQVYLEGIKGATRPNVPLDPSFDSQDARGISVLPEGEAQPILFHQYVYCFGFDPRGKGGPAEILDNSIEVEPVYDTSLRFGNKADQTVIAYATRDQDLWVVGASVFREMGQNGLKGCGAKYKRIPDMLCAAGTPPEGVAAVKASIKAVTAMPMPTAQSINWNLADRLELQSFLSQRYGNVALATVTRADFIGNVKKIADKIIERRQKTTFGWKIGTFNVVVVECAYEVLDKFLPLPFKDDKFPYKSAGIDDLASFLRERYNPKIDLAKSDQIAKALVNDPGRARWSIPDFNIKIQEFAGKAGVKVDQVALR